MDWTAPFAIYRINAEGQIQQVHMAMNLKDAKYWLTYIAHPGDVLCKTPAHPKHSKETPNPEYWSHKEVSGHSTYCEEKWRELAKEKNCSIEFPEAQTFEGRA